ncbi:MAG TPA: GTPase domain-containing protein [bacterium]|nr:GTPase domain-containing protein [bacterium]
MVFINKVAKEVNVKIVYYGAGLSGKTTNIEYIYNKVDPAKRGKLISLKTETERTLFFDFMPVDIGKVGDMSVKVHLYSVPGQVFYDHSRKLILKGTDGIVFVVDAQVERMDANVESFSNLKKNLLMNSILFDKIPLVIQYNKVDLPNAAPVPDMQKLFNPQGRYPELVASALSGEKVFDTFKAIVRMVIRTIPLS